MEVGTITDTSTTVTALLARGALLGQKHSEETKIKCGIKNKGKKWWNDGTNSKFCLECPGNGWILGRIRHW